jgi:chromosome segregation ATPase
MSAGLTRRLKPEEEEILRKRQELAAIRAALAERELQLVDLRTQLATFEGRYLRQVGALYAELDEWKARIAEVQARLNPSSTAAEQARSARERARQTYQEAHSTASEAADFTPSPELKGLFRKVARLIHPDFCRDAADLERRTRYMAEANRAYEAGDVEVLQRILEEFQDDTDVVKGEGVAAELIRIIRQIHHAKDRLAAIERELAELHQSEIALLMRQAEERFKEGGDLLGELADSVREQIGRVKTEYESLAREEAQRT